MKHKLLLAGLLLLVGLACQQKAPQGQNAENPLRIACAANVQFALQAIIDSFTTDTGQPVELIVGASGSLATQIRSGAPFHLFFSADLAYPCALHADGYSVGPPRVYALGKLIVWTRDEPISDPDATLRRASCLAIANPRLAPYGTEARRYLRSRQLWAAVQDRLIVGENIAQTNSYVQSGACAVAITAASVLRTPALGDDTGYAYLLPQEAYEPIRQGMIVSSYGARTKAESCAQFVDYLRDPTASAIFQQFLYEVPD